MSHAINAWLGRHARQIRDLGLARDNQIAADHRWQAREIKPSIWEYRDPRFDLLAPRSGDGTTRTRPAVSRASTLHGWS